MSRLRRRAYANRSLISNGELDDFSDVGFDLWKENQRFEEHCSSIEGAFEMLNIHLKNIKYYLTEGDDCEISLACEIHNFNFYVDNR